MKKIIISLVAILIFKIGFSQNGSPLYPITQNLGSSSSLVDVKGGQRINGAFVLGHFVDTAAANAIPYVKNFANGLITTDTSLVWLRSYDAKKWLLMPTQGRIVNGDSINYLVDVNRPPGQLNVYGKFFNGINAYSRLLYTDSIGSGGGSSYTFQYPLSETAGVAKIDTNFFWKPYGNSAINPLLNFLGTTDSNSLVFKVNNFHSGLISYATISPVNGQPASKGTHFGFGAGAYSASLGLESGTYFGNGTGMYAGDSTSANTFIGNKAGLFHSVGGTFGGRNVAIGEYSQYSSVRGYDNTSVGVFALNQNFSGFGNSAFGRDALKSSLDGNGNSAFGAYSLWHNTSGVVGANIANGGSGYTTATVTLPAPTYPSTGGTCFEQATATAIISGGSIVGITITNPGCGYITSSYGMNKLGFAYTWAVDSNIVITGDGTGAAATVIFGSGEGNSAYGVYSGTYRRLSYYDTYIGYQSGHSSRYMDSLNLFIGYSTDVDASIPLTTNIIKSTAIGYNAKVGASNTLILGGTGASQPSVGIGTITPNPLRFLDVRSDIDVNGLRLGRGQGNINSNAIFGFESGYSLTSGIANTGVGYRTLKLNTTGGYNTAFGWNSLVNNQTATLNTAIGVQTFTNLVSSSGNTAIGSNSFYTYTGTGVTNGWNVGVGNYSGFYTTIGHSNTFIGSYAGSSNQTGYNNIALGIAAFGGGFYPSPGILTSSANDMIAVGTLSLQNAAQGGYSIGIGFEALRGSNGATGKNIAIGYQAGKAITTGNYNVVIGGNDGTTIATKSNHIIISDGDGNIRSVTDSVGNIVFSGTGAMTIHIGTTAQRPSSPTAGMYRFNSDSLAPEFYSGSAWLKVSQGGGGSSGIYDTCTIATFSAGAGFSIDTTAFTDSTIYGSFYNAGNDTLIITSIIGVVKNSGKTIGVQAYYNTSFNTGGNAIATSTLTVTSNTTGNSTSTFTNQKIPPGNWVWMKSPTITAGQKPTYLSVSLIGYKKRI